tara:strand:+ start:1504 stop:1797 length:294 start_codon:yes stop_codon:yes gene_type:complete
MTLPVDLFVNHERELSAHAAPILLGHLSECLHQVRLKYQVDTLYCHVKFLSCWFNFISDSSVRWISRTLASQIARKSGHLALPWARRRLPTICSNLS